MPPKKSPPKKESPPKPPKKESPSKKSYNPFLPEDIKVSKGYTRKVFKSRQNREATELSSSPPTSSKEPMRSLDHLCTDQQCTDQQCTDQQCTDQQCTNQMMLSLDRRRLAREDLMEMPCSEVNRLMRRDPNHACSQESFPVVLSAHPGFHINAIADSNSSHSNMSYAPLSNLQLLPASEYMKIDSTRREPEKALSVKQKIKREDIFSVKIQNPCEIISRAHALGGEGHIPNCVALSLFAMNLITPEQLIAETRRQIELKIGLTFDELLQFLNNRGVSHNSSLFFTNENNLIDKLKALLKPNELTLIHLIAPSGPMGHTVLIYREAEYIVLIDPHNSLTGNKSTAVIGNTENGIINYLRQHGFETTFFNITLKRVIEEFRGTLRKREINDIRKDKSKKYTKRRRIMTSAEKKREDDEEEEEDEKDKEEEEDRKKGKRGGVNKRQTQKQK